MTATTATPGIGHNARPLPPVGHPIWPDGAEAVIARRKRPVWTSGKPRTGEWVLRFERRTPPFIEPLMGWTGGDDTLAQVELTFGSRDEAIAYAEREGLSYRVAGEATAATRVERLEAARRNTAQDLYATAAALAWMDPRYGVAAIGRRPDLDRALVNPAAVFASPAEVLHDPSLSPDEKREVLRRWAWDAWLLDVAAEEAMAEGEPSRLDEVKAALLALDRAERMSVLVVTRTSGAGVSQEGRRVSAADEAATEFPAGLSLRMERSGREAPVPGEWSNLA